MILIFSAGSTASPLCRPYFRCYLCKKKKQKEWLIAIKIIC